MRGPILALLILLTLTLAPACRELEILLGEPMGGASPPPSGSLSISFIDVEQGDSVLVQAGGEDYLIDAGQPEQGPNVVDFLRSRGVDKLDGLVSSGPDADHSGGLPDVLEAFTVENIYLSGYSSPTITYNNTLRAMNTEKRTEGAEVTQVRAGDAMDWSGVQVDVWS